MRLPRPKVIVLVLAVAAVVALVGVLSWPTIEIELLSRKKRRWSATIRETILRDSEWRDVQGYASMKSGHIYAEIGGAVQTDASLQRLKTAIHATGFPFPVRYAVTVTNINVPR
jgi:hypothetical protein